MMRTLGSPTGSGRLAAVLTVALMIVQILVPAAPAVLAGEGPTPTPGPGPGLDDAPAPGPSVAEDDTQEPAGGEGSPQAGPGDAGVDRSRSPLAMVANASGTDAYTGSRPVTSPTLGLTAPPEALATQYVKQAAMNEHVLRSAILAWNDALQLRPEEEVLDDPELYEADELPGDVQVPAAALLYALTDATLLQGEAIQALEAEDRQALLDATGQLVDPSLAPTDPAFVEAMDALATVGSGVDMDKIQQASRIVAATLEHVRPMLQAWSQQDALAEQREQDNLEALQAYTETYAPEELEEMHRVDRLEALVEGMQVAARLAGGEDALPERVTPVEATDRTLSEAIADVASAAGAPVDEAELALEQQRAEALPEALQQALTRVLTAYEAWFEAATASLEDARAPHAGQEGVDSAPKPADPNDGNEGELMAAQLAMLATVRDVAPTLEAFGLLYDSHAHAMMPATSDEMPQALPGLAEIGAFLTQPDEGISAMTHAGAMLQGADLTTKPQPALPPEGALEELVLDLYDRYNLKVNASTRQALATGVDNVPAPLERNTARVLQAQLSATDRLTELYQSLGPDELGLLASGVSPEAMQQAVLAGNVTTDQLEQLETYHELLAKTLQAYYKGSLELALALDASQQDLDEWRSGTAQASTQSAQAVPAAPGKNGADSSWWSSLKGWAGEVPEALSVLDPIGVASAQPQPEPQDLQPTYMSVCEPAEQSVDGMHELGEDTSQETIVNLYEAIWGGVLEPLGPNSTEGHPSDAGNRTLASTPAPHVTDCENDVLFMDPLLQTVVVSGVGTTVYEPGRLGRSALVDVDHSGEAVAPVVLCPQGRCPDPQHVRPSWTADPAPERVHVRGQILSLDLGGDDVYRNNAGGSFLSLLLPDEERALHEEGRPDQHPGPCQRIIGQPPCSIPGPSFDSSMVEVEVAPSSVAVALDLGGDDTYEPPSVAEAEDERLDSEPNAPYDRYFCGGGWNQDGRCQREGGVDGGWPRVEGGAEVGVKGNHSAPGEASAQERPGPPVTDRAIQGASLGGVGLLWDVDGDDRYAAGEQAQGFGGGFLQDNREDMPCFETVHAACLFGLMGVGVLADDAGDDAYAALRQAQGAAGPMRLDHHVQAIEDAGGLEEEPGELAPPVFGGTGVLADRDGDDVYHLDDGGGTPGQGFARAGVGLLADGRGDDAYRWGLQGQGTDAGVGALVDLSGEDAYTRRHADTGHRFDDRECRGTYAPGQTREGQAPGFGVFVDVDPARPARPCTIDPFRTPNAVREHATRQAEWALGTVVELLPEPDLDPGEALDDGDNDTWSDGVETLAGLEEVQAYGWNASDEESYPAGFPDEDNVPEKPDAWPGPWPFDTYPPDTGPYGSDFIVRVPGVVAIGDSTNTTYEQGDGGALGGVLSAANDVVLDPNDHRVTIDLGGADTYENKVGGFGQLAIDVGDADDTYENEDTNCLQGCDGYLLDMGGDDEYLADRSGRLAQGASNQLSAALFDADGDDVYQAGDWSQGAMAKGGIGEPEVNIGSNIGLLVDAAGDDTYRADTQGVMDTSGALGGPFIALTSCSNYGYLEPDSSLMGSALFLELQGDDIYRPVGDQGQTRGLIENHPFLAVACDPPNPDIFARSAAFVDNAGWDTYVGTTDHPDSPDFSEHRNDRLRVNSHTADRFEVFWDQDLASTEEENTDPDAGRLDMPSLGIRIEDDARDNVYESDYALLLDPGGDDMYTNNAGASLLRATAGLGVQDPVESGDVGVHPSAAARGPASVAALALDLAGNDTYDARDRQQLTPRALGGGAAVPFAATHGQLAQGAGLLGVGVLADGAGDDAYTARGLAQGAGVLGAGILWDVDGDDIYSLAPDVVASPSLGDDERTGPRNAAWAQIGGGGTLTGATGWRVQAWFDPLGGQPFGWEPGQDPDVPPIGPVPPGAADVYAPSAQPASPASVQDIHAAAAQGWLNDGTVLFSAYDGLSSSPSWNAYVAWPDTNDEEVADVVPLVDPDDDWVSNQRHATTGNQEHPFLWVDDNDGTWSIYTADDPQNPRHDREDRLGPPWAGDSNQTHPQITDAWSSEQLVWQDDRDDHWGIFRLALGQAEAAKVFPLDDDEPEEVNDRDHVNPVSSDRLLAWETTADGESWDVVVYHPGHDEVAVLDAAPGWDVVTFDDRAKVTFDDDEGPDRFAPSVSGERVLFTERDADGDTSVREFRWGDEQTTLVHEEALHPELGPSEPGSREYVYTSTDGRERACEDDSGDGEFTCASPSPFWEIVRVGREGAEDLTGTRADTYARLMQGASLQGGLGALLDVEGNDAYEAQDFAQGAAMSSGRPGSFSHGVGLNPQVDHGAHGALVDLAGNERYTADRYSQGAHFGTELRASHPIGGLEATENAGVLFDLRGLDTYRANERSQGASSLVAGTGTVHLTPGGAPDCGEEEGSDEETGTHTGWHNCQSETEPEPGPPAHNFELTPVLAASAGLLTDLGGEDTYAYSDEIHRYPGTQGLPPFPLELPRCGPVTQQIREEIESPVGHPLVDDAVGDPINGVRQNVTETLNDTQIPPELEALVLELLVLEQLQGAPAGIEASDEAKHALDDLLDEIPHQNAYGWVDDLCSATDDVARQAWENATDRWNDTREQIEQDRADVNETIEEGSPSPTTRALTGRDREDPSQRDDSVWRQPWEGRRMGEDTSVGARPGGKGGTDSEAASKRDIEREVPGVSAQGAGTTDGDGALYVAASPGGVGADLSVMDEVSRALGSAVNDSVGVDLKVLDGNSWEPINLASALEGQPVLRVEVSPNQLNNALDVEEVELFVEGSFQGYGEAMGVPEAPSNCEGQGGSEPWTFCMDWDTSPWEWPDGDYNITARVHYGLQNVPSRMGYLDRSGMVIVDNPPRVALEDPQTQVFSPNPVTWEITHDDVPQPPEIAFDVSPDVPGNTDNATTWVRVEAKSLEDESEDRITVWSTSFNAAREGAERIRIPDQLKDDELGEDWDGTWDGWDGDVPVNGTYALRVLADDEAKLADDDESRTAVEEGSVRVDAQPPRDGCVLVEGELDEVTGQQVCNPGASFNDFVGLNPGRRITSTAGETTVTLRAGATDELRQAHVFNASPEENGEEWQWAYQGNGSVKQGEAELSWTFEAEHGEWTRLLVLFEDRYGNLECVPGCNVDSGGILSALGNMSPDKVDWMDAIENKTGAKVDAAYATFLTDLDAPTLDTPDDGVYHIDGQPEEASQVDRVGPNQELEIHLDLDEEAPTDLTDVGPEGRILWETGDGTLINLGGQARVNITCASDGESLCQEYDVRWDEWGALLTELGDLGQEDTDLIWTLDVEDVGGNEVTRDNALVPLRLDSTRPGVIAAEASYFTGTTASQPDGPGTQQDNKVRLTVQAEDRCRVCTFSNNNLTVTVDISEVTDTDEMRLDNQTGTTFSGQLDVTQGFPGEGEGVKRVDLPVTVTDIVNNTNETATIPLVLGAPELGLSHQETTVQETTAQIVWTTTGPTTAELRYGPDDADEPTDTLTSEEGTSHVFELEGLERSTRYGYEIVATDPEASDVTSQRSDIFATHAGLEAHLAGLGDHATMAPAGQDGVVLSGVERLEVEATVAADPDAEPLVAVTAHNDALPGGQRLLVEERTRDGLLTKDVITSALPDGLYEIHVNATHRSPVREEVEELRVEGVRLDNTAPELAPASPAPNATIAGTADAWRFHVEDALSAIDASSATLRVNGEEVGSPEAVFVPDDGSPTRGTIHLGSIPRLPAGEVRVTLTVADAAGNTGVASLPLHNDPDAPRPAGDGLSPGLRVDYPADRSAARPGEDIRLAASLDDATGVAGAWVNATPLGGPGQLQLQRDGDEHVAELTVPSDANASVTLTVTMEDELGNRDQAEAHVLVDAHPPSIADWEPVATTSDAALFRVQTDEPVEAAMELTGPDGTALEGEPVSLAEAALLLEGDVAEPACRKALEQAAPGTGGFAAFVDVWEACEGLLGTRDDQAFSSVLRVTGLDPGDTYDVRVHAADRAGWSDAVNATWRFTPVVVEAPTVGELTVRELAEDRVRLSWSTSEPVPENAVRYTVYRAGGDRFQPAGTTLASTLEDTVEPGRAYTYYVQAENLEGSTGPPSPRVDVETEPDPRIATVNVTPTRGTPDTPFTFHAVLEHAASASPDAWLVLEDGTTRRMGLADPGADCRETCTLETTTTLPALDLQTPEHGFHVDVADAGQMLREPAEGHEEGPTVLAAGDLASSPSAEGEEPARSVPGPGLAILVAMLGAAWMLTRRRDER